MKWYREPTDLVAEECIVFPSIDPARCCYNETLIYQEIKSILLAPSVYSTHKQKLTETNTGLFIAEMSD